MLEIHLERNIYKGAWEFFVFERLDDQKIPYKITVEKLNAIDILTEVNPSMTFRMPESQLKDIIDKICTCFSKAGFLVQNKEALDELKATKYHLEDMRQLVFKK